MIIQLSQLYRINSNPCGGFDLEVADLDKETKDIKTRKETGKAIWKFKYHHPTIDRLLESYVMECTPVVDETLTGAMQIMATIRAEYAEVKKLFEPISKELSAVTLERDKLREQLKGKGKKESE
jgi:hypothetical protein